MTNDELDILLARHLDGSASAAELAELDRRVAADPVVARALLSAAADDLDLRRALPQGPAASTAGTAAPKAAPASAAAARPAGWFIGPRRVAAAAAAAVLVVAAGVWVVATRRGTPPSPVATAPQTVPARRAASLAVVGPGARIERVGANGSAAAASGTDLSASDRLRTGPSGGATVAFAGERSQVVVAPSSDVAAYVEAGPGGGNRVELAAGAVTCDVAPQSPDRPFVVTTAAGRVQVVGTRFTVRSAGAAARVEVEHGTVRVTRSADGATVDVSAGEHVAFGAAAAAGFPKAAGKDMSPYWSTRVRPAGIQD